MSSFYYRTHTQTVFYELFRASAAHTIHTNTCNWTHTHTYTDIHTTVGVLWALRWRGWLARTLWHINVHSGRISWFPLAVGAQHARQISHRWCFLEQKVATTTTKYNENNRKKQNNKKEILAQLITLPNTRATFASIRWWMEAHDAPAMPHIVLYWGLAPHPQQRQQQRNRVSILRFCCILLNV